MCFVLSGAKGTTFTRIPHFSVSMESYYIRDLNPNQQSTILTGREFHHCVHVLRHRSGDEVNLVDGRGWYYKGRIMHVSRQDAELEIIDSWQTDNTELPALTIGIAPLRKPARFEFCLEKLTELGVRRITPLKCHHNEKHTINRDRLIHILVSAMKQSERAYLPVLDDMTSFDDFVRKSHEGCWKGIAGRTTESLPLSQYNFHGQHVVLLIGPEGDFTEEEWVLAAGQGFNPVSFGNFRLRTETAAITGAAIIHEMQTQ